MPSMIRPRGKAKKIAYKILGRPANMTSKETPKQKKVDRLLDIQETRLIK